MRLSFVFVRFVLYLCDSVFYLCDSFCICEIRFVFVRLSFVFMRFVLYLCDSFFICATQFYICTIRFVFVRFVLHLCVAVVGHRMFQLNFTVVSIGTNLNRIINY